MPRSPLRRLRLVVSRLLAGPLAGLLAALLLTAAAPASAFPVGHPEDPPESLRLGAAEALTAADVDFTAIVALYRLTQTHAELTARYGVTPLTIGVLHPEAGAPIRIVSGFWRRIYDCSIDRFVYQLRESVWTFTDSIRFTEPGCETIGGTSGSPIIHATTGLVVGINNTGNEDGARCTLNNPL